MGGSAAFSMTLADEAVNRAAMLFLCSQRPNSLASIYVPRGEVGQGASTHVFVLNVDRPTWCWGNDRMFAPLCLNAGLLVDAEHRNRAAPALHLSSDAGADR